MYCNNCGKEISTNATFCPNCGTSVNNNMNNGTNINSNLSNTNSSMSTNVNNNINTMNNISNMNNMNYSNQVPVNNMNNYNNVPNLNNGVNTGNGNNKSKNNKTLIICLVVVIALILVIIAVLLLGKEDKDNIVADARTVLIYLCGSDLESQMGLATYDLSAIDPKKVDLDKMNIVVYTGGAKTWHNYIENDENAIYVLEEDGFVKKESYKKASMGNSSSLQTLLDYGYENYKADKYDLIMWNHGLGALGISSDELHFNDYLNLNEVSDALKKSNFNGDNKFETVVFRSCLNSTLEMATVFVPYANYFVASEEVTWGGVGSDLLGFLNDVTLEDSGVDFGKKFITSYEDNLNRLAKMYNSTLDEVFPISTYSILDLTKVDELENKLNLLFNDINLDLNYYSIAKIRSNLYQYGSASGTSDYDTVDLYALVSKLKTISSNKADSVLTALDNVIVYNWSNNTHSNGLAIYFPYNSSSDVRQIHYNGYKNLDGLSDYYNFIKEFDDYQADAYGGGFSVVGKDEIKLAVTNKQATLEISNTDIDEFAKASYTIFTKNSNGTYLPVYVSDTFELAKNTYTVDLNTDLIKVTDKEDNSSVMLTLYGNAYGKAYSSAEVIGATANHNANIYFNTDKDVAISKVLMTSKEESKGMFLDINEYESINFMRKNHNVLVNNSVVDNWETSFEEDNFQVSDYTFEKVAVDSNCYVMFKIYDVDNLYVYSDLVQVK